MTKKYFRYISRINNNSIAKRKHKRLAAGQRLAVYAYKLLYIPFTSLKIWLPVYDLAEIKIIQDAPPRSCTLKYCLAILF